MNQACAKYLATGKKDAIEMNIQPIPYSELTLKKARAGCWVIGMPNEAYHAYEGISNSGLTAVLRSPAHYAFRSEWKTSRAMEIGTAFHAALFEPRRYANEYQTVDVKDRRASEYKQAAKTLGGDKVLTRAEGDGVEVMKEAILSNESAAEILTQPGWCEISGFVQCPDTGVLLRCRFDFLTETGRAVDLKKTQDARAWAFSKAIHSYGYHRQEAFYRRVFELIQGEPMESFQFLAVEEQPPCASVLYTLDDLALLQGQREVERGLAAYSEAEASGNWRSYETGEDLIGLPAYALEDVDEGEII